MSYVILLILTGKPAISDCDEMTDRLNESWSCFNLVSDRTEPMLSTGRLRHYAEATQSYFHARVKKAPAELYFRFQNSFALIFRLRRMHKMQTIVSDAYSVCLSVCPSRGEVIRCSFCYLPNHFWLLFTLLAEIFFLLCASSICICNIN